MFCVLYNLSFDGSITHTSASSKYRKITVDLLFLITQFRFFSFVQSTCQNLKLNTEIDTEKMRPLTFNRNRWNKEWNEDIANRTAVWLADES